MCQESRKRGFFLGQTSWKDASTSKERNGYSPRVQEGRCKYIYNEDKTIFFTKLANFA